MKTLLLTVSIFFLITINVVKADVKLPVLVSNGMVLQRDKPIKIWGWASPSEKVSVSFLTKKYKTNVGADGKWQVVLPARHAGGPYNMVITGINKIELTNILIGDVWFCSGQSNMEFSMSGAQEKYADEIANCKNPQIRQFAVPERLADETEVHDDLTGGAG
jgi:sialate O-acetylesterase